MEAGTKVGAVGPVGEARSCLQNPIIIDVADEMSAWEVLHPVAATEEATEIAAGNRLHTHVQSPQLT